MAVHAVHPAALALGELLRRDAVGACTRARCRRDPSRAPTGSPGACRRSRCTRSRWRRSCASGCPARCPSRSLPPPTCTCSVVTDSVFFSSSAYSYDAADLVAVELLRPVALLAGVARRPQVLHRRRNRPRVGVERHRQHLPRAGELRLREPRRARTDVALHARDARVRAVLVRGELGLHHACGRPVRRTAASPCTRRRGRPRATR